MKIAAVTDDGKTISQHFGRSPHYLVITIEDGHITSQELRNKLGHRHDVNQPHTGEHHGQGHGMDPESHNRHLQMAKTIADCETLLCRGMGMGAYQSLKSMGIRPIVTDIEKIDEAVKAYLDGSITDHIERLH